jgi:hypothetical protein
VCTYLTEKIDVDASGKGAQGWIPITQANVYVDVINPGRGPSARVALEMTEESALALAQAILDAIASAPPGLASAGGRTGGVVAAVSS